MPLFKRIFPGQWIGIIGGGQLGKMMAQSAKAMGFRVSVLDPVPDCPAGQVADEQIVAPYEDRQAIKRLAKKSDVITYEFENIHVGALEWLQTHSYVPQGTELLRMTSNRITEKAAILASGVETVPYTIVRHGDELPRQLEQIGFPAVLKTLTGGYDGKGQLIVRKEEDTERAKELIRQGPCVLEKWIPFKKELSVIITRNGSGERAVFPVAENIHRSHILHETVVPARISKDAEKRAVAAGLKIADHLQLVGTLAVEMFLTDNDGIYINELAPRPHNSGHFSIEACETSQFEQHIRAICNWPLGSTALLKPVVMVNILGQHLEPLRKKLPGLKDWHIHIYGKTGTKPNRKMGHVTLLRERVEEALVEIEESGIWEGEGERVTSKQ